VKFGIEPIESSANVIDFAVATVVLALAEPGAAKVEAKNGKSEAVQGFHGMEDDFVVERAAEERMGMADERGMAGVGRASVEQGFEASGGAVEKERADGGVLVHSSGYTKRGRASVVQIPTLSQNARQGWGNRSRARLLFSFSWKRLD
jgi:hypothetical protein